MSLFVRSLYKKVQERLVHKDLFGSKKIPLFPLEKLFFSSSNAPPFQTFSTGSLLEEPCKYISCQFTKTSIWDINLAKRSPEVFLRVSPGWEPPSPDPLSARRIPAPPCSERHPRPGHLAFARCHFHPRMSAQGEEKKNLPLSVWTGGKWFWLPLSHTGLHLAVGLIAERPPLLPNPIRDVPLVLRFGRQQAIVAGPLWHAVAQAGLCRERRHPVAGECCRKSCDEE